MNTISLLQYLCVVTMLSNCLQMFNVKYEITNVNNTDCIKEKTIKNANVWYEDFINCDILIKSSKSIVRCFYLYLIWMQCFTYRVQHAALLPHPVRFYTLYNREQCTKEPRTVDNVQSYIIIRSNVVLHLVFLCWMNFTF